MILEGHGRVPGLSVRRNPSPILRYRQEVDGVADFHIAPLENVSAARSHIGWHADFVVFQLDDVACIVHQEAAGLCRVEKLVVRKPGAKASVHGCAECEGTKLHASNIRAALERDLVLAVRVEHRS